MPGRDFYLWQAHSFTARVALDVVDSLGRALADPRHKEGQELGGVLFGRILQPENIEITNAEFIHSQHHRGTVFALGLRERDRVSRQLALGNGRSEVHPVGFFRTHLRPGLFLDQDDLAFMTEAFADPSQVALLIRPAQAGSPAAGFFIWEDGDIDRRQTLLSFPFDSQTLRAQGPVETRQIQPPAPLLALPNIHIPVPHIRKPMLGWSVGAVALIALLALGMQYRPAPSSPRKEVERPLNIALQRKGDAVIVDWDKRATALKQASSGVLTIQDGGTTQKLNLSRTELDHGKVQFWPRSDEVSVHMDLTHQNVAGSTANLAISRPPPQTVEAKPTPLLVVPIPPPRPQTVSKRRQKSVPRSTPNLIAAAMPPPARPPPAPEPDLKTAVEAPPVLLPIPPPSITIHARSVAVSISVEPKQSSELKKVVSRLRLLGRSFHAEGGSDYSPARPTRPLAPDVPQMIAKDLSREISVDVKVSIDKHGSVKNAHVLSGGNSMLANLAANTAETTLWEPAKQGDRTVSSDVIVHYRFSPTQ
jgi:outer membrane biosynthesis protein TonB